MDTRWNSFPKGSYMRTGPPSPLSPPQHTSEPPLIARNVLTLYVHSSPSSPSPNCTPSTNPAAIRTRSTSYSILSDEVSTTIETHDCHLPYCHPRVAFPLSDETCSIVLNPYTHISIGSPSRDSSASEFSLASRSSLGVHSSLLLDSLLLKGEMTIGTYLSAVEINNSLHPNSLGLPFID